MTKPLTAEEALAELMANKYPPVAYNNKREAFLRELGFTLIPTAQVQQPFAGDVEVLTAVLDPESDDPAPFSPPQYRG